MALSGVTLNKEIIKPPDPRKKGSKEEKIKVIDSFIDEIVELLTVENKNVRSEIMNLTGTSISPASYCLSLSL
jgi:hypothetical protein